MSDALNERVIKCWHARHMSYVCLVFVLLALFFACLFLISFFDSYFQQFLSVFYRFEIVVNLRVFLLANSQKWLLLAILCACLGIGYEIWLHFRARPVFYVVRDELIQALSDLRIIKLDDAEQVKRLVKFSGVPRWNKLAKCYELRFSVRSAKATRAKLEELSECSACFKGATEVRITDYKTKKGYTQGYLLSINYGDPFEKLKEATPWD